MIFDGASVLLDLPPEQWLGEPPDSRLLLVVPSPGVAYRERAPEWAIVRGLRFRTKQDLFPMPASVRVRVEALAREHPLGAIWTGLLARIYVYEISEPPFTPAGRDRDPAPVVPIGWYCPGDSVWVWRDQRWWRGDVRCLVEGNAALVDYQDSTGVDAFTVAAAECLAPRARPLGEK